MFNLRLMALASLALTGFASAQNSNRICSDDFEVQSNGDVDRISSCGRFQGSITIGKDVTLLSLPQLQTLDGDLIIDGAEQLNSIELRQLRSIGRTFRMNGLTRLTAFSAPELSRVGTIYWNTLPNLSAVTLTRGITQASSVTIWDTNLVSLQGINLSSADNFDVQNNRFLRDISTQLGNVTDVLAIKFNAKAVSVSLPNLETVGNMTFSDVGNLTLPSLKSIKNSASFINNTIESLLLPNLTSVGQSIAWVSNTKLTQLSVPELATVGGTFQIANNTLLANAGDFSKLKSVGGAVDCAGTFKESSFPALEDVRGGFNFQTTEEFDCKDFNALKDDQVVKGDDFTCEGSKSEALTKDGQSGGKNGTANGAKKGAAAGSASANIMTLVGSVAGLVYLLL